MTPPLMPQSTLNAITIYLTQWLKIASGGRVYFAQQGTIGLKSFYVFKCKTCGDNWHVGAEHFVGSGVPEVLIDWVKTHRHVGNQYTNTHGVTMGTCSVCGGPYGAHEQSWINPPPSYLEGKIPVKTYTYWEGTNVPTSQPTPHVYKEKPLPIFKGRKFRDDSDEGV